jgi:hypothetical protein
LGVDLCGVRREEEEGSEEHGGDLAGVRLP